MEICGGAITFDWLNMWRSENKLIIKCYGPWFDQFVSGNQYFSIYNSVLIEKTNENVNMFDRLYYE